MPLWPKITSSDYELTLPFEGPGAPLDNGYKGFVFFDAGMVIVDLDWEAFVEGLATHFGSSILDIRRFLAELTETSLLKNWECGMSGPAVFADGIRSALQKSLKPPVSEADLPDNLEIKNLSSRILGNIREPVIELAHQLKKSGYSTGILSNATPWHETDLLLKADVVSAFDLRLFSQDLGCAKPDPRIYELAEARAKRMLGMSSTDYLPIYFIDDTPANVRAARRVGWQSALVNLFSSESLWHDPNIESLSNQKAQLVFGLEAAQRVIKIVTPLLGRGPQFDETTFTP